MRARLAAVDLPAGCALAATGSLARGELTAYSDLDLVLIHPPGPAPGEAEVAAVWAQARATGRRVDYSVRTPADNVAVLAAEPTAALALLDLAPVAGDTRLVAACRSQVLTAWRRGLTAHFDDVARTAIERWRRSGSLVAMTRPDLKQGRGGLRDHDLLRALALGNLCDAPDLSAQRGLLLAARARLHEAARRRRDVLDPEFAVDVAEALGFPDRFELARALAGAALTIDRALTRAGQTARAVLARRAPRRTARRPLDVDVVDAGGQVHLARNADLTDAGLALRVAAASARTGLDVPAATWDRLTGLPALPARLPRPVAADFVAALSSPRLTAGNVAALDSRGLWQPLVPEWDRVRGLLPREPSHTTTVDRHTLATVAGCARLAIRVPRPDLLLIAGLYHDLGKGTDRPHAAAGAEAVARFAARLGLPLRDRSRLQTTVAEHTTIARIAAETDPDGDEALSRLLDATGHDLLTVELLGALVEADAQATGPGVFTRSLRRARDALVARARGALAGLRPRPPVVFATGTTELRCDGAGRNVLHWHGPAGQMPRLLAVCHALAWTVEAARARLTQARDGGRELVVELDVRPGGPGELDVTRFRQTLLSGVHSRPPRPQPAPTAVEWRGRVLDVRTRDRPGVLAALTAELPGFEWLTLTTVGATAVGQVALTARPLPAERKALESGLLRALGES